MKFAAQKSKRFLNFGLIGIGVYLFGTLLLVILVEFLHLNKQLAYFIQGITSIELNFVLNASFTWRDRSTGKPLALVGQWARYHLTRIFTIIFNQALFAFLIFHHIHYIIASVICLATSTAINYLAGEYFIFRKRSNIQHSITINPPEDGTGYYLPPYPRVSVVIPIKNSQRTIRQTVESLLAQKYSGNIEIIIVGDHGDSAWDVLQGYLKQGIILGVEVDVESPERDSNAKRNIGLKYASGLVLALTDSDMVLPSYWVARGVAFLQQGWDCVAGGMYSVDPSFLGLYVDRVIVGSKTPRFERPYCVTAENFGVGSAKPPITANVFLTRTAYSRVGGLDYNFVHSYEDYQWFWEMARKGICMLCTPLLTAAHHHRNRFRKLVNEYMRSGRGCADFIRQYPSSPFSRKRKRQFMLCILTLILFVASTLTWIPCHTIIANWIKPMFPQVVSYIIASNPFLIAGIGTMFLGLSLFALGIWNAIAIRRAGALLFPFLTLVFTSAFLWGVTTGLISSPPISRRIRLTSSIKKKNSTLGNALTVIRQRRSSKNIPLERVLTAKKISAYQERGSD
jgi:succinoglycan biosynthesis protein ExoA